MNKWLALALCGAVGVYAILRACMIPVTVDEAATCMNSVPRPFLDVLTYRADPVPNNHILNTLGIQLSTMLFGMNTWSVRVPALLGGLLYLMAAWGISRQVSGAWQLQLWTLVLLLANLYVVEFFALARGYGLACGLMLGAIWQAWIFFESGHQRAWAAALALAGLSVLANFALLNFFAPFVALLVVFALIARWIRADSPYVATWMQARSVPLVRTVGLAVLGVAATAGLCYLPLKAILGTDQLVFWKGTTFWNGLVISALEGMIHRHIEGEDWVYYLRPTLVVVVTLAVTGWLLWLYRMLRARRQPPVAHTFVTVLFGGVLVTHFLQVFLLDAPYLDKRTSLFLYPLLALHLAVLFVGWWSYHRASARVVMAVLAVLIGLNWYRTANLRCSHEWYFDEHTFKVLDALKVLHQQEQRTTPWTLQLDGSMLNSFIFHTKHSDWPDYRAVVAPIPWHGAERPKGDTDFYVSTNGDELPVLRELGYRVAVDFDPKGSFKLWRK
jgi:hypothetical protein